MTHFVEYINIDGTIIKSEQVEHGGNSIPPANPVMDKLIFNGWNRSYNNITNRTQLGATYLTEGNKTWIQIEINAASGKVLDIYGFFPSGDTNLTIDWGDGSSTDSLNTTPFYALHTYEDYGIYWVSIHGDNYYALEQDLISGPFSTIYNAIIRVYMSDNLYVSSTSTFFNNFFALEVVSLAPYRIYNELITTIFSKCYSLVTMIIPDGHTTIGTNIFADDCISLKYIIFPESVTTLGTNVFACDIQNRNSTLTFIDLRNVTTGGSFAYFVALEQVILSDDLQVIITNMFSNCILLKNINLPTNLTTIQNGAFSTCQLIETLTFESGVTSISTYFGSNLYMSKFKTLYFKGLTPPTVPTNFLGTYVPYRLKIYVPTAAVDAYKTSMSTFANYIYDGGY